MGTAEAPGAGDPDRGQLLTALAALAEEAGRATMAIYAGEQGVRVKSDGSPVTAADLASEAIIAAGLARLAPDIPTISEEAAAEGRIPAVAERFFLVDPLDGTKEFIARNGEFTVNIALIEAGAPTLGVICAPALGRLYAGARGAGAWRQDADGARRAIRARPAPARLVVVGSRSHAGAETRDWLARFEVERFTPAGSSLKFCLVASGEADLYPRFGRTMAWDTAAGEAILRAAGGCVSRLDGTALDYRATCLAGCENGDFVAWGDPALMRRAVLTR
ncbi:MAG: 3'(2'),5'-bisphosphate nucleotidase CysQ [Rhizobiales bacterium]|nr:3'(2'),5'-bisphosphate nucleotidase CysQ [Hyphomicrobiales bacterium]